MRAVGQQHGVLVELDLRDVDIAKAGHPRRRSAKAVRANDSDGQQGAHIGINMRITMWPYGCTNWILIHMFIRTPPGL